MKKLTRVIALLTAVGVLGVWSAAFAAEPTQADFDACNKQAKAGVSSPAASPSTTGGAGAAPGATPGSSAKGAAGGGGATGSAASDPQLKGMAAAGQSDAAYQTAYRDCMTKRGF